MRFDFLKPLNSLELEINASKYKIDVLMSVMDHSKLLINQNT